MFSPFPIPLAQLSIEHVRAFLSEVEEEGVTWEAKADGPDGRGKGLRPEHVRSSVCGLANQIGGYLVIGAAQREGAWQLVGVASRDAEPGLWLDKVLRGLRPAPRYRRQVFDLSPGRWAAVVEVEPLTQTPCMTADGQVFERVSSETIRVTDPTRLAELFARGQHARAAAETLAGRAADTMQRVTGQQLGVGVVVGLAAASYEPDIGSRLFHERFRRQLDEAFEARLFTKTSTRMEPDDVHAIRQACIQRAQGFGREGERAPSEVAWLTRAQWDGAVAVAATLSGSVLKHGALFDLVLLPAWRLAADLVAALGGYGDARVCIRIEVRAVAANLGTFYRGLPGQTEVTRSCEVAEPGGELIGSVQRELQRAAGLWSFEGTPDPPPSAAPSSGEMTTA